MNKLDKKVRVARLSVISNSLLIVMKFTVGIIGGSVSVMSEAIHSVMDLFASVITFFSVKISNNPPDEEHPYGHGKIENVSGVIEALLIFVAVIWILCESVKKLTNNEPAEAFGIGSLVMFVSVIVNFFVSRRLYKVAKATDSIALEANALHLKTDMYTSLAVGTGLLLIWLTNLYYLDPIIAIIVALFILTEAYKLLKNAYLPLLDVKLSDNEISIIKQVIEQCSTSQMNFHQLRTRKSGSYRYIDLHLEIPQDMTVKESHNICDMIEKEINKRIENTEVSIHVEPFETINN